jgi:hypothetical protein
MKFTLWYTEKLHLSYCKNQDHFILLLLENHLLPFNFRFFFHRRGSGLSLYQKPQCACHLKKLSRNQMSERLSTLLINYYFSTGSRIDLNHTKCSNYDNMLNYPYLLVQLTRFYSCQCHDTDRGT